MRIYCDKNKGNRGRPNELTKERTKATEEEESKGCQEQRISRKTERTNSRKKGTGEERRRK